VLLLVVVTLTGCGEKKRAKVTPPPPPTIPQPTQPEQRAGKPTRPAQPAESLHTPSDDFANVTPVYVEVGVASWYGPPYHNRKAANGEIFDMNQLTAAHRTLPSNSLARVINVTTGSSTLVRITDRGPFIEGRMLDLSLAAAKAIDTWRAGLATVRLEVLQTPSPIATGGRWCVQIGAFTSKEETSQL